MLDVELFKLVLNGGCFALMAVFVLWVLFREFPSLRAESRARDVEHGATLRAIAADHKTTMDAMAAAHRSTVETLSREFRAAIVAQAKECREERAEMTRRHDEERAELLRRADEERVELLRRHDESAERDRDSRHKIADQFTAALNHLAVSQMKAHPAAAG